MLIRDRGSIVEVDDVPGLHWFLGVLFVVVGGLFFVGPLGVFTDADKLRWWLRVLISFFASPVPISTVWAHGRDAMERVARAVASSVGVEAINVRGESDGENVARS